MDEFRARYRDWLAAHVPASWRERDQVELGRWWMRERDEGGWSAPSWPVEHGGMGATTAQQIVMYEEEVAASAPSTSLFGIALNHAGATLIVHGSDEQREHLPRIRRGEEIWCQGFSEPDAGSDLAALSTRAVRDGDHYVVTGQKVWSSFAEHADWCLLLVRTDPEAPKRKGISYLLLDLRSPGVEVRPLRQITGSAEFSEIFLDEVRVPVANRVGPENEGWSISQTTLTTERGPFFLPSIQALRRRATEALERVRALPEGHVDRQAVARDYAEAEILGELYGQVLTGQLGPEASIVKLLYTDVLGRLTGHVLDAGGIAEQVGEALPPDVPRGGTWMLDHLQALGLAIGGGTSEIQRNLIGERVLGLPREPVA